MIKDAARRLFSKFGYRKTAVDEIARDAHIAKGTIYNYFSTKDDLIRAVFREEEDKMVSQVREHIGEETEPADKLKKILTEKLGAVEKSPLLAQVLSEKRDHLIAGLDKELERLDHLETDMIEEILREGNSQLSLAESELEEMSRAIQRALRGLELSYLEGHHDQIEQDADLLLGALFDGLKKKPSGNA
jgi:AcrR family transcriptional regulator